MLKITRNVCESGRARRSFLLLPIISTVSGFDTAKVGHYKKENKRKNQAATGCPTERLKKGQKFRQKKVTRDCPHVTFL